MFKAITRFTLALVVIVSSAGKAHGQSMPGAQPAAPGYAYVSSTESAAGLLKSADARLARRDFSRARWLYRRAANVERASGAAPIEPLRRLANAYYLEGLDFQAAEALGEVAEVAAQHGDLVAQADAYANAAVMYGRIGYEAQFNESLDRLKKLLQSAYMPAADRERLLLRMPQPR